MEKLIIFYHHHLEIAQHHLVLALNAKAKVIFIIDLLRQTLIKTNLLNQLLRIKYEYLDFHMFGGFHLVVLVKYYYLLLIYLL